MSIPVFQLAIDTLTVVTWVVIAVGIYVIAVGVYLAVLAPRARELGVPFIEVVNMWMGKAPPRLVLTCLEALRNAGIDSVTHDMLRSHVHAGGDINDVSIALVHAKEQSVDLTWDAATAIDLAGGDVVDVVERAAHPWEITVEHPHGGPITAVAQDGIELLVRAAATVRLIPARVVGGAAEPVLLAALGAELIRAIGRTPNHVVAMSQQSRIVEDVLSHLDFSEITVCVELVALRIVEMTRGRDIGAMLQEDQRRKNESAKAARSGSTR